MILLWLIIIIIIVIVIVYLYRCDPRHKHRYIPLDDFDMLSSYYGNSPWLSVIVSIYNKQDVIRTTIDSIINNSIFEYIEVILVDDCSTDNTVNILNEYVSKYKNIKLIKHERNQSIIMTRKHGVERATGTYIHFMDGDDTLDKYFYEELLRFIVCDDYKYDVICANNINRVYKNKQAIMDTLHCKQRQNNKFDKFKQYLSKYIKYQYNGNKPFIKNGKLSKYTVYVWTKLYRNDFIKRIYGSLEDTYLNLGEDVYINYYILCNLHSYIVINNVNCYNYYLISDSISHNDNFIKNGLESIKYVKNKLNSQQYNQNVNKYIYNVINRGIKDCSRIEFSKLIN